MPQSEIHDLIVELRSLTLGVGTFTCKFDHLQELVGRIASIPGNTKRLFVGERVAKVQLIPDVTAAVPTKRKRSWG